MKQNVMMTSQNHSYVVKEGSLVGKPFDIRFINVNDGSVEGIVHRHKPILSVQYHPEAHPGPHDAGYIFDEFLQTVFKGENVYA